MPFHRELLSSSEMFDVICSTVPMSFSPFDGWKQLSDNLFLTLPFIDFTYKKLLINVIISESSQKFRRKVSITVSTKILLVLKIKNAKAPTILAMVESSLY